MTRLEALARTVKMADAFMARQLDECELVLLDCGASSEDLQLALGAPGGYWHRALLSDRNAQIAEVAAWLAIGDLQ